jgi:[protein-PII] uridylyltransferase
VRRRRTGDGVEAVLYTPQTKRTFAHVTAVLDELGMTIVDARVVPLGNGFSLDSFIFMELDKRMDIDESRMTKIRRSLTRVLTSSDDDVAEVTRVLPRQARMFTTKTIVDFNPETTRGLTVMELESADRPGLLSIVGKVFIDQGIGIDAAKVMTIGERAEDVFYISNEAGAALGDEAKSRLRKRLIDAIDDSEMTSE